MVSNSSTKTKRILFSPGFEEHPGEYGVNGGVRVKRKSHDHMSDWLAWVYNWNLPGNDSRIAVF